MAPVHARSRLLFLVMGQLVGLACSNGRLRTDHVIESAQMRLGSNGAIRDCLFCVSPVSASWEIAPKVHEWPLPNDEGGLNLFNL